ncbi:MAG: hypothetical protein AAF502_14815 [Bacteroidota bacterium]
MKIINHIRNGLIFLIAFLFCQVNLCFANDENPETDKGCPDLEITTVKILEQKRKCIIVEYELVNKGDQPVRFGGDTRSIADNLAIQAHFSGDRKLNKGDILADGDFLIGNGENLELAPDETYKSTIKVSLKAKTNHIGVLILKADATHITKECDETNNTNFVIIPW